LSLVCRHCIVEEKVEQLNNRVEKLEKLPAARCGEVDDSMSTSVKQLETSGSANECIETARLLGGKITEAEKRISELESKLGVKKQMWPTLSEIQTVQDLSSAAASVSGNIPASGSSCDRKVSFSDKCKNRSKETVIVVGDSLVRGVGSCLEKDSNLFTSKSFPGMRLEHMDNQLKQIGEKPDSHVVLMIGTNNLKGEGSETILEKYEELIDAVKVLKYRKLSFVSIPERRDISDFQNSRRLGVNRRLEAMCAIKNVGFVDVSNVEELLGKDGLHLNFRGQDSVARDIFRHCILHLN